METRELRIGNLLYFVIKTSVCTVNGIWFDDTIESETNGEQNADRPIEDFYPIPITEEWLLKFGFEINNSIQVGCYLKYINENLKQYLCIHVEGLSFALISNLYMHKDFIFTKHLKYVHQLQNLYFALTGEELTLNEKALS